MADGASSEAKRVLELVRGEDNPTRDEVTEAAETLKLKEHERPEGFTSWNGGCHVRIPDALVDRLRVAQTVAEMRALMILVADECASAEQQREEEIRSDSYEMNGAGAVMP